MMNNHHGFNQLIAVEGCIAAGKTTLAKKLASHLRADNILENFQEIESVVDFYKDRTTHAFRTEMEFTRHHYSLLIKGPQCKRRVMTVADFTLKRDLAFALLTLKDQPDNLNTYKKYWQKLSNLSPKPSVVILLEASVYALMDRVNKRGREFEQNIEAEYLANLTRQISELYVSDVNVIRVDTTDFTWLNDNFETLARDAVNLALSLSK